MKIALDRLRSRNIAADGYYDGIYADAARILQLSSGYVRRVDIKGAHSEAVSTCLNLLKAQARGFSEGRGPVTIRYISKRRSLTRDEVADTFPSRKLFQRGGCYFGLIARVAREIGLSATHVRKVSQGLDHSPRVAQALLEAIAVVDSRMTTSGGAL